MEEDIENELKEKKFFFSGGKNQVKDFQKK